MTDRHEAVSRLAHARLHSLARTGQGTALRAFHARYKYLLMACDPVRARALGRIAAAAPRTAAEAAYASYERELRAALARRPERGGHANALLHMFGYVSGRLAAPERTRFLDLLERYRQGQETLGAPAALLHEWIARQDVAYLKQQAYFEPLLREFDPRPS